MFFIMKFGARHFCVRKIKLSEQQLLANMIEGAHLLQKREPTLSNITCGIDHGVEQSWIVFAAQGAVKGKPEVMMPIYIEEISTRTLGLNGYTKFSGLEHVHRMKKLISLFDPNIILSDANGLGSDRTVELIRSNPFTAWGVFYDTESVAQRIRSNLTGRRKIAPAWNEGQRTVTISKLNSLRLLISDIDRNYWRFPGLGHDPLGMVKQFFKHATSLAIQPRVDLITDQEYEIVVKLHPLDHLLDCWLYADAGRKKLLGVTDIEAGSGMYV